ncbi:MAG: DUF3108 domain-containing protein [Lysobacteraceae bacterium]|nr:MAG: DUF3108 domain-containing protein [Xanthomonadaceae bacterium]
MDTATNNGTRLATLLGRHGRLLALCGLSLLLHLLVIAWIDASMPAPPAAAVAPLAVRLADPRRSVPATPPPPALADSPTQAPAETDLPSAAPASSSPEAPESAPAPPAGVTPEETPAAPPGGAEAVQMPSRYRVSMPPPVTLVYEVRDASGPAGEATLHWETDGVQYRLALDGILGRIDSEGATDDAGIAPHRTSYRIGTGSASVVFERERRVIMFQAFGRSARDTPGSQDGATVLMQLAGIGLADPDQMQEAVEILVGRADAAAVERFQMLGRAPLATPLGSMETLHLVRGGGVRLEVWLAPAHGWLPVQLRATAPDGSVRTQVVKEIRSAPAG